MCVRSFVCLYLFLFFFKQKTAYELRISDWSSDVCSSDLGGCWQGMRTWTWGLRGVKAGDYSGGARIAPEMVISRCNGSVMRRAEPASRPARPDRSPP